MLPDIPLTTRGDVAAVGIGFTAGFAIDALLIVGGIPPGTFASLSAVGCVSAKNALQGAWNSWREPRKASESEKLERHEQELKHRELHDRASTFEKRLEKQSNSPDTKFETGLKKYRGRLVVDKELLEDGLLTNDQFEESLNNLIGSYRRGEPLQPHDQGKER